MFEVFILIMTALGTLVGAIILFVKMNKVFKRKCRHSLLPGAFICLGTLITFILLIMEYRPSTNGIMQYVPWIILICGFAAALIVDIVLYKGLGIPAFLIQVIAVSTVVAAVVFIIFLFIGSSGSPRDDDDYYY